MPAEPTIDVPTLIAALSRPEAYPHPVCDLEVHQTHISVVFLAGPFAYKIKKPVNLGFLDFSTLEKRRYYCDEEIRLNRRLAAQVYLGVVPISADLRMNGSGPVIEWAVQMKRLPAEATLESRLHRGEVHADQMRDVAKRLAVFHRHAESSVRISSFGRFEVVAKNARENFTQSAAHQGITVSPTVNDRLRTLTDAHLAQHHDLIEARAERNVPRDTHGDLHLDHVYLFPAEKPPNDLLMIDCIEFDDRFRYADPVADMAFLAMDFAFHGRRDLAGVFTDAYFGESGDAEGRALLPFYSAYRAIVRAKVDGIELGEREIEPVERARALARARAHWLLALGELEEPASRPALVMVAGLPGSGKSTLAKYLAACGNFALLRSDVIRKELASAEAAATTFDEGIYSEAWTDRTYGELMRRAEQHLWQGRRVLIDANFRDNDWRERFLEAARRWGVPALFIHCETTPQIAHERLNARRDDASDADWRMYQQLANSWQPLSDKVRRITFHLDTSGSIHENEKDILAKLRQVGLLNP